MVQFRLRKRKNCTSRLLRRASSLGPGRGAVSMRCWVLCVVFTVFSCCRPLLEGLGALRAVDLGVVNQSRFDLGHGSLGDGFHGALAEQGLHPRFARDPLSTRGGGHAGHAEVAQLVLGGEVDNLGQVAHAGVLKFLLHGERVLEGGALTDAGAVTDAHDKGLRGACLESGDDLGKPGGGIHCIAGRAHRHGETGIQAEAGRSLEVELGPGGVHHGRIPRLPRRRHVPFQTPLSQRKNRACQFSWGWANVQPNGCT